MISKKNSLSRKLGGWRPYKDGNYLNTPTSPHPTNSYNLRGGANKITSKRSHKKNKTLSKRKLGGWKSCEKEKEEYDCSSRLECKWRDNACELDELMVAVGLDIMTQPRKG
jgi:hypothetical protein